MEMSEASIFFSRNISIIRCQIQVIFDARKAGEEVKWRGGGTFVPRKRAERKFSVLHRDGAVQGLIETEPRLPV
jgi:hypothetical protein